MLILTMKERLECSGVKTIYPDNFKMSRKENRWNEVVLEYNDIRIFRPNASSCVKIVNKEFNLNI
tara:strand:- start:195 stop:389 length:195 start_codon:yes stop_codon:yes gene_type:complete